MLLRDLSLIWRARKNGCLTSFPLSLFLTSRDRPITNVGTKTDNTERECNSWWCTHSETLPPTETMEQDRVPGSEDEFSILSLGNVKGSHVHPVTMHRPPKQRSVSLRMGGHRRSSGAERRRNRQSRLLNCFVGALLSSYPQKSPISTDEGGQGEERSGSKYCRVCLGSPSVGLVSREVP